MHPQANLCIRCEKTLLQVLARVFCKKWSKWCHNNGHSEVLILKTASDVSASPRYRTLEASVDSGEHTSLSDHPKSRLAYCSVPYPVQRERKSVCQDRGGGHDAARVPRHYQCMFAVLISVNKMDKTSKLAMIQTSIIFCDFLTRSLSCVNLFPVEFFISHRLAC